MMTDKEGLKCKHGATGGAYALLLGLISVVGLAAVTGTGSSIDELFTDTATVMGNVATNSENILPAPSTQPSPSGDTVPDAFDFANYTGTGKSITISSAIIQITGLTDPASVGVTGAGSPQFRVCADAACASVLAGYSPNGVVNNDEYVQLSLTSASTDNSARTATIDIGGVTDSWTVTTGTCTGSGSASFTSAGMFSHTIPANLTACAYTITVKGGGGGSDGCGGQCDGGNGGGVQFTWYPTSTGSLDILVGGGGGADGSWTIPNAGGYGGGGTSGPTEGGGGGASAVAFEGTVIAISGGGGGGSNHGGCNTPGGAGGGGNNAGQDGAGCGNGLYGRGGSGGTGGIGAGGNHGHVCGAGGSNGNAAPGNYGGDGFALFNVSGGGGPLTDGENSGDTSYCDAGGAGYGGGGAGLNGGGGGGGFLNTSVTYSPSIITGGAGGSGSNDVGDTGEVSLSWAP